jgi:hypothetical protein
VSLSPSGETVEQLVSRSAESGLAVRWAEPPHATPDPGGIAERVLYRVVREELTNAARHAPWRGLGGGQAASEVVAPGTARHGRSCVTTDLRSSLQLYATAVARGARAAIANARAVSRLARHQLMTNSTPNSSSPASVHISAVCCTHVGVPRARWVMSR